MQTRKQRLFNNNPRGAPRLKTLGYGTEEKAKKSIRALRRMPAAYQRQAATTMFYRAKHHARQTHVLHIGDDAHTDVWGAREAGLHTVWINPQGQTWTHVSPQPWTVRHLSEVADHFQL